MSKFMSFSKMKKILIVSGILILLIVVFFLLKNGNNKEETIVINSGDFINQVSVSGKVVPSENVDLAFKSGGLIEKIYFSVGQKVKKGQIIAGLEASDVKGALEIAKANYQKVLNGATSEDIDVAKASVETAQISLDQTKTQQDTLVKNAKKNLLNSGFIVTTEDQLSVQIPPVISGTYLKEDEGQINLEVYPSSGGYSFKTKGLIETIGMVNTEIPQPIGNTGLYIKFNSSIYDQTKWVINIPNKQSSLYLQNLNAYQSALSTKDQSIANAEAILNQAKSALTLKQSNARPEDVISANGSLLIAQGNLNDKFIIAPFDGIITKVDAKAGEIASPNIPVISLMSEGTFQIESYVPEVNIAKISIGNDSKINLDAYGENVFFNAKVVSIDPAETIRNGVSTYKTKLQFIDQDDRIKSGMTANVAITIFSKPNVIVVPGGVVYKKNEKNFVKIKEDKKIIEREIIVGDSSSLGQIEVVSGLSNGDMVILNPVIK